LWLVRKKRLVIICTYVKSECSANLIVVKVVNLRFPCITIAGMLYPAFGAVFESTS
jgi:hypothetical protein